MVSQMSMESYSSRFPLFHSIYPSCGGEWGENPVMGRSMVGWSTAFVYSIQIFIELFHWEICPFKWFLTILLLLP